MGILPETDVIFLVNNKGKFNLSKPFEHLKFKHLKTKTFEDCCLEKKVGERKRKCHPVVANLKVTVKKTR